MIPGNPYLGVALMILVVAIMIPIAVVVGKGVFTFLGGLVGPRINRELVTRIKSNILSFTVLHKAIKADLNNCNISDLKWLKKECGDETINSLIK